MSVVTDVNIGATIRKIIAGKGISQAQLGRMLGKPATYITRLLNKESIDTDTLCVICEKLKYNIFVEFSKSEMFDEEYQAMVDLEDNNDIWSPGCILQHTHIGNRIIDILKRKKITQAELGEFLGVSHQEVSRLLKNSSIDTAKLVVISNFLNYDFFRWFYEFITDGNMKAGEVADHILIKYLTEVEYTNEHTNDFAYIGWLDIEDTITAILMDREVMTKYRKNIRNMVNLINILYKENQALKEKTKGIK